MVNKIIPFILFIVGVFITSKGQDSFNPPVINGLLWIGLFFISLAGVIIIITLPKKSRRPLDTDTLYYSNIIIV